MCAAYYSAALNSLVHMVMYMYYFLASAIGRDEKKRRKYLWWGKYLTMFQMTQFVTMVFQVPPRLCPLAPCTWCLLHACGVCSMQVLFAPCTCCLLHARVVCSMHVWFAPCTCCLLHARVICSKVSRLHLSRTFARVLLSARVFAGGQGVPEHAVRLGPRNLVTVA